MLIIDQADRIRMSSFVLERLRQSQQAGEVASDRQSTAECVARLLAIASRLLRSIGESLIADQSLKEGPDLLKELHLLEEAPCRLSGSDSPPSNEIWLAIDTLAGQLRAALELAQHATPQGLVEFARHEAAQPWKLQLQGWLGTLRANLHFESPGFRHAVRLATCVALGDAIARGISWQRSYWLPMTVAVVLKPDFTTTFSRGVLRLAGTFIGLILATALYTCSPHLRLLS